MKEFKGTKGEWILKNNGSFFEIRNSCDWKMGSKSMSISVHLNKVNKKIKTMSLGRESEANAKLIAAAPELLKCLIDLYTQIPEDLKTDWLRGECENAEKAIDKAL